MNYWNRKCEVSQAQWTIYGLLEMACGAIAAASIASIVRAKAVNEAFENGRICGRLQTGLEILKNHFTPKKDDVEEESEESEEEAE